MQAKYCFAGALAPEHIRVKLVAYPAFHVSQLLFIRDVVLGLGNPNHLLSNKISNRVTL